MPPRHSGANSGERLVSATPGGSAQQAERGDGRRDTGRGILFQVIFPWYTHFLRHTRCGHISVSRWTQTQRDSHTLHRPKREDTHTHSIQFSPMSLSGAGHARQCFPTLRKCLPNVWSAGGGRCFSGPQARHRKHNHSDRGKGCGGINGRCGGKGGYHKMGGSGRYPFPIQSHTETMRRSWSCMERSRVQNVPEEGT